MKTATRKPIRFADLPTTYADLVALLPPRTLRDRLDAAAVEEIVLAMAGFELSEDQEDYLNLMSDLLEEYQQRNERPRKQKPLSDRLKYLLEEAGLKQSQFAKIAGITQPAASMILSGQRGLSKASITKLAKHFRLQAEYFM